MSHSEEPSSPDEGQDFLFDARKLPCLSDSTQRFGDLLLSSPSSHCASFASPSTSQRNSRRHDVNSPRSSQDVNTLEIFVHQTGRALESSSLRAGAPGFHLQVARRGALLAGSHGVLQS